MAESCTNDCCSFKSLNIEWFVTSHFNSHLIIPHYVKSENDSTTRDLKGHKLQWLFRFVFSSIANKYIATQCIK